VKLQLEVSMVWLLLKSREEAEWSNCYGMACLIPRSLEIAAFFTGYGYQCRFIEDLEDIVSRSCGFSGAETDHPGSWPGDQHAMDSG